jgi:phage terminase small subunit
MAAPRLTPKQLRFVQEFLVDMNATQAAIRAGYSPKTAYSIASENLRKPEVIQALQEARQVLADRLEVTQEKVLLEYARVAFASMDRFMSWNAGRVSLKASEDLTPDEVAAVAEISQTVTEAGGTLRLKLHEKKGALDSLAKHLGLFKTASAEEVPTLKIIVERLYELDGNPPAPPVQRPELSTAAPASPDNGHEARGLGRASPQW